VLTDLVPYIVADAQGTTMGVQWDSRNSLEYGYNRPLSPGDSTVPVQGSGQYPNGIVVPPSVYGSPPALLLAGRFSIVCLEIVNSGNRTLTAQGKIEARAHPNGAWFDYITNAQLAAGPGVFTFLFDWVAGTNTGGNPGMAFGVGKNSQVAIRVGGLDAIRFNIKALTGGNGAMDIRATTGWRFQLMPADS